MLDANGNVVTPEELVARIERLLDVDGSAPRAQGLPPQPSSEMTVAHTNALHALREELVLPAIDSPPGLAAPGKRLFKRAIRKLTWWYVEPRWRVQNDFDAHSAHFATAMTDELARLSRELESERKRHREQQVRLAVQISSATTRLTELQGAFARANESQRELVESQRELVDRLQQLASTGASRDEAADLRTDLAATRDDVDRLRRELLAITTRLDLTSALGADINHLRFASDRRGRITDRNARRQYVQWLPAPEDAGTVIDLGCGRGEMLELLAVNGFEAVGVDQDPLMIAHCRKAGYDVTEDHPVRFLEGLTDNSITAIFCLQLVDRLLMPELEVLAELCQRKLARGGVMIVESINPQSLHAYANQLLADATHVQAVHPDTLQFVCEQVGFEKVVVSDVARHPLADLSDEVPAGAARDAVSHLLSTVYGSTQYVLVATK